MGLFEFIEILEELMELSKFIKILEGKGIKYELKGDIISIIGEDINLSTLKYLPKNVQFNNGGSVDLDSLTSPPESTFFNNSSNVYLRSLKSAPKNFLFNNDGGVYLKGGKLEVKPHKEPIEETKTKRKPIQKLRIYKQ